VNAPESEPTGTPAAGKLPHVEPAAPDSAVQSAKTPVPGLQIGPRRRVVLLGASNLTRGLSTVLQTVRGTWGAPVDILAALGRGRSYGAQSRFLFRSLSGILDCGIWPALAAQCARGDAPLAALVTDIGNDILYGSSVRTISAWVAEALDRLIDAQARVCITQLPVANLETLSPRRFEICKKILVPTCPLRFEEVCERTRLLNEAVIALAEARRVPIIAQRAEWYGIDPIHLRMRAWPSAWREIMSPWLEGRATPPQARNSLWQTWRFQSLFPEKRHSFGAERFHSQPVYTMRDGTTLALY
jgi:hypothetical protein